MQAGHEHLLEAGKVALLQVQADEIRLSRRLGSLLVGFCYGGKEPAMAGFGDQPTPRRAVDWRAT